ncbi:MAG: flagellar basal body-associated FliL family protein [Roseovarius sp.]|nr:flagellar basal body-associated FliL family protein [Roseovarius sp.]
MAEPEETEEKTEKKASKLPLILGLVLALVGGGGGFFAVYSGMLPLDGDHKAAASDDGQGTHLPEIAHMPDVAFVPVDPLTISMGYGGEKHHLRFRAELEVKTAHKSEVERLMPRVVDVLNNYLRALNLADIEDNTALVRLRAQMLRRVQIVTGGERVNDLLIMEFVLN